MTLTPLWKRWPKSLLLQALIAFLLTTILAIASFFIVIQILLVIFNHEYPHDGQNGLGAFMGGLMAAIAIEFFGTAVLFVLQYRGTRRLR